MAVMRLCRRACHLARQPTTSRARSTKRVRWPVRQLKESIEAEVERWRDVVPHLRVVRCIDDGPAAAEEQVRVRLIDTAASLVTCMLSRGPAYRAAQRWELVAREVQAMLRSVPQATADTSSPSDSDATA